MKHLEVHHIFILHEKCEAMTLQLPEKDVSAWVSLCNEASILLPLAMKEGAYIQELMTVIARSVIFLNKTDADRIFLQLATISFANPNVHVGAGYPVSRGCASIAETMLNFGYVSEFGERAAWELAKVLQKNKNFDEYIVRLYRGLADKYDKSI